MHEILQFHAEWCGPCKKVAPILERLVSEADGVTLRRIDINEHPEEAERWNVSGVPTMIHLDEDGQVVARTRGAKPAGMLQRELQLA